MAYEVIILGEAEQFIRRLDVKMRAKTARSIGLLRQFGYRLISDKTSTAEIERAMRLRTAFIKELSNGS